MALQLVIGNKNYSSWSLRPWLFLRQMGVPFEEIRLSLFTPQWPETIRRYSPTGQVPALLDGDISVWDSLAILDYVQAQYCDGQGWPRDRAALATARAVSAEMHAGFAAIRTELPQNIRRRCQWTVADLSPTAQAEVDRVATIWQTSYDRYGGPWLFGDFSIADAMYAPVALRFVTYGIELPAAATPFIQAVVNHPAIQAWGAAAQAESEILPTIDAIAPFSHQQS
jgi:glutathione S-transferase